MTISATNSSPSGGTLERLIRDTMRKKKMTLDEAIDSGFEEGLRLAAIRINEWQALVRAEGLSEEIGRLKQRIAQERRRLFAADVSNSQAIFESYLLATDIAKMLTAYLGIRATLISMISTAERRGIRFEKFTEPIEAQALRELSNRYLLRPRSADNEV